MSGDDCCGPSRESITRAIELLRPKDPYAGHDSVEKIRASASASFGSGDEGDGNEYERAARLIDQLSDGELYSYLHSRQIDDNH